jgi:hypothetical protein
MAGAQISENDKIIPAKLNNYFSLIRFAESAPRSIGIKTATKQKWNGAAPPRRTNENHNERSKRTG